MKILAAILCDFANESKDGRPNLISCGIDQINCTKEPSEQNPAILSAFFYLRLQKGIGEEGSHEVSVLFMGPDGEKITSVQGTIPLDTQHKHINFLLPFNGVQFKKAGSHSIEILIDKQNHASLPIEVLPPSKKPSAN